MRVVAFFMIQYGVLAGRELLMKRTRLLLILLCIDSFLAPSLFAAELPQFAPGVSLLEGKQASLFLQQPLASFCVYAFHAGAVVSIPFQLDERDRRERWTLERGPRPNADNIPQIFDENDAIVVMNRDLGERGDPTQLPAGATLWGEMRVGSAAEPLGFAYIGAFAQPSPLSLPESVPARYEEGGDRVYAERYTLEFRAPLPKHIAFVETPGEFGVNAVAGVHAVGEVRLLGGLITLHKTDADIQTELLGYKNGPVRAIRRARYWIPLPLGFRTTGRVDLLFYRNFVEGTAMLKIGIPPRLVLASGELQAYFDFLRQDGARVLLAGETPSEPVDGRMTPAKRALVGRPARWAALLLPDGRTVVFIVRLEGALQRMEQHLYFEDVAEPGETVGGRPFFGFQFTRIDRLKTGTHRLSVFAYVLDSVNPADIRNVVDIFLAPPGVAVTQLTPAS
jgi:hypothetical protein